MMIALRLRTLNPKIILDGAPKFLTHRVKMVEFDRENKVLMAQVEVKFRKISRKRFERIAMALGIDARDARWIADQANQIGLEYKDALRAMIMAMDEPADPEEQEEEE